MKKYFWLDEESRKLFKYANIIDPTGEYSLSWKNISKILSYIYKTERTPLECCNKYKNMLRVKKLPKRKSLKIKDNWGGKWTKNELIYLYDFATDCFCVGERDTLSWELVSLCLLDLFGKYRSGNSCSKKFFSSFYRKKLFIR